MGPKTLFVRYCGGCNPQYDRVAFVQQIAQKLGAELVYDNPENADCRLIVSGCISRCATPLQGLNSVHIYEAKDLDGVVENLCRQWQQSC